MRKVYHFIILCILLVKVMNTFDENAHLDLVFQKALRYSHHRQNCRKESTEWSDSTWFTHKEATSVYTNKITFLYQMRFDTL